MPQNPNDYCTLRQTWTNSLQKENFFVSYAVRGPTVLAQYALQQDMPCSLNNRYQKRENFCGACQGINGMTFPNRAMLRKLYQEGKLTEYSNLAQPAGWKKNSWD